MKMFSKKYKVEDNTEDDWGFYIDTDTDSDIENGILKFNYEYENEYENDQYNYSNYNLCRILKICNCSIAIFIILSGIIKLF
jgi:hypothetical protein